MCQTSYRYSAVCYQSHGPTDFLDYPKKKRQQQDAIFLSSREEKSNESSRPLRCRFEIVSTSFFYDVERVSENNESETKEAVLTLQLRSYSLAVGRGVGFDTMSQAFFQEFATVSSVLLTIFVRDPFLCYILLAHHPAETVVGW